MLNNLCLQFNRIGVGSGFIKHKFSDFFLVICAIILFLSAPVQVVEAADTVTFAPTMVSPVWSYYPDGLTPFSDDITSMPGNIDSAIFKNQYFYAPFHGTIETYSNNSMVGGYSYSGTFGVKFAILWDPAEANLRGVNGGKIIAKETYLMVDSVEFVIDGTSYSPFLTKTSVREGTAYYTVKDLYASANNRFLVRIHVSGYSWFDLGRSTRSGIIDRTYVSVNPNVTALDGYSVTGTTSGFKDNLTDFDQSMNEGSSKENQLTDQAFDHINSYEFSDLSSGAGMASALSFYSSVVMAGYTSLGDFKQLFGIVFALIIIVVILRIRRDSS
jgi:hypothetical protein